jgi:hypothetical protein
MTKTSKTRRRLHLRVRDKDMNRLDMIAKAHDGISRSAAFRAALMALCIQLGLEKNEFPDEIKE